ncbi:MAG: hypothetical protein QOI76_2680 [Frankiales bacterium]|nr:hypothetical protein [Frankiales bacterium]
MSTVLGAERALPSTRSARARTRAVLTANLQATLVAAAGAEALTAVVRATGVHLAVGDPGGNANSVVPVNVGACSITLAMVMVLGTGLSLVVNRWARRPATVYLRTTVLLTTLSLLAPVTAAATSTATKLTLIGAHLLAAAVVIPVVSRALGRPLGQQA